jgi:anti-sigma factor RsiW
MRETDEMTCREVSDFLGAYLAGELPAGERTRFDEHLVECPDCRTYLRQYEATRELCRGALDAGAVDAGVPEELVQAILAARPSDEPPREPRSRRRR